MGSLEVDVKEIVISEGICAGCRETLGEEFFVSPCRVKYCTEGCYKFYNED